MKINIEFPDYQGVCLYHYLADLAWLAAFAAITVRIPLAMVKNRLIQ